ncbi:hypothetical protein ACFL27_08000 [candidate division CSSED10-310 bacterium]|uniref:Uncharacterized protein n=1 Tax=candidate division CSSED10-310 bacterium TaxID=2855610 RepID=A0ABV6YV84_UNCC1
MNMSTKIRIPRPKIQVKTDWRVQELLRALNDQILSLETVSGKITSIVGFPIKIYRYRDGSYFICE